jgi:hypothetical protein
MNGAQMRQLSTETKHYISPQKYSVFNYILHLGNSQYSKTYLVQGYEAIGIARRIIKKQRVKVLPHVDMYCQVPPSDSAMLPCTAKCCQVTWQYCQVARKNCRVTWQ